MKMSRRSAIATATSAVAASAAASLGQRLSAAEAAIGSKGRIHHSVCKWCYPKIELEALALAGKEFGLRSIELLEVKEIPTVQKHGLTCAMVSGIPGGITKGLNRVENHDAIAAWFEATAPAVAKLGCENIICFSGNRAGQSDEDGIKNCAAGLQRLLPIAEKHKVVLVMELLNSKVNHADYQCDLSKWGVALCEAVGSERFKLLYDIYHMQIMEGDIIRTIQQNIAWIGHIHTAGNPGRHEFDDTQEIYYPPICRAIADLGFTGYVSHEYTPTGDPVKTLEKMMRLCEV